MVGGFCFVGNSVYCIKISSSSSSYNYFVLDVPFKDRNYWLWWYPLDFIFYFYSLKHWTRFIINYDSMLSVPRNYIEV